MGILFGEMDSVEKQNEKSQFRNSFKIQQEQLHDVSHLIYLSGSSSFIKEQNDS